MRVTGTLEQTPLLELETGAVEKNFSCVLPTPTMNPAHSKKQESTPGGWEWQQGCTEPPAEQMYKDGWKHRADQEP